MFLDHVTELRSAIDDTVFDVDALSLSLAFLDATTIAAWVAREIAFEAYPGVLRGPAGTLMARAGNAHDQAVLLALLLRSAGWDARIAVGRLDAASAEVLIARLLDPRLPAPSGIDADRTVAIIDSLARSLGLGEATTAELMRGLLRSLGAETLRADDPLTSTVRDDTDRILSALRGAGIEVGTTSFAADVVEEARDYAWVQYRLHDGESWTDAHPAFGASPPPAELVWAETFDEVVPEHMLHRLRVESLLTRRLGAELQTQPLMAPWERPTANLVGTAITYTHVPDGRLREDLREMIDVGVRERTRMMYPFLMGTLPAAAMAFDLLGSTVPPAEAAHPAAGVVQSTGAGAARAVGALGGLGSARDQAPEVRLEQHVLRYTLIAPDGNETTSERVMSEHTLDSEALFRSLTASVNIAVDVGPLPDGYLVARYLDKLLSLGPLLSWAATQAASGDPGSLPDAEILAAADLAWIDHLPLFQLFRAGGEGGGTDRRSYRHAPAVVVHQQFGFADDTSASIDVIANPRRIVRTDVWPPEADIAAMVFAGVWESHTEGLILTNDVAAPTSAAMAIRTTVAAGQPLKVILPERAAEADSLGLNQEVLHHLRRDLARGYVVIVPEPSQDATSVGWWRVSLADGETLAILPDGRGGAVIDEHLILFSMQSGGMLAAVVGSICLIHIFAYWEQYSLGKGKLMTCTGIAAAGWGLMLPLTLGIGVGLAVIGALAGLGDLIFDLGSGGTILGN